MSRLELIAATAAALFAAFAIGWLAAWAIGRVSRASKADPGELDRLAEALHEAEVARDEALSDAEDREAALHDALARLRAAEDEITALRDWIERAHAAPR